jgi:dienelactone hydrolase
MFGFLRILTLALLLGGWSGCADEDGETQLVGPDLEVGPGRIYKIKQVSFPTTDGVQVSALFGPVGLASPRPAIILLHDIAGTKETWLTGTSLLVDLLELGYAVVAVDLRGFGETPLPDSRQVPELQDLEESFRDVYAACAWLQHQPEADPARIGLIGNGSGGNIAYVSMGVFPQQIKTAVVVSAGLWERNFLQPVVVGQGLDPFAPRSILFIAGAQDTIATGKTALSYSGFARDLAATTAAPKTVFIVQNTSDHGLALVNKHAEVLDSLLRWLEENL